MRTRMVLAAGPPLRTACFLSLPPWRKRTLPTGSVAEVSVAEAT